MTNPLESDWFFQMVERGGKTPTERLLAIFSVTEQWIAAPGIRDTFLRDYAESGHLMHTCHHLKRFLSMHGTAARIEKPDVLANHLVILLQGAIVEELRNPGMRPLSEAARAAKAVIANAHTRHHRRNALWLSAGSVAAGVMAVTFVWHAYFQPAPMTVAHRPMPEAVNLAARPAGINPSEMEAVLVLHEQVEKGACPAPQLLALTPGQMTAYMNVINFRTPENPAADRENIHAFLAWYKNARASECYYAPVNGHTSVAWTAKPAQPISR